MILRGTTFVKVGDVWVNPDHVASVNDGSERALVRLVDGHILTVLGKTAEQVVKTLLEIPEGGDE